MFSRRKKARLNYQKSCWWSIQAESHRFDHRPQHTVCSSKPFDKTLGQIVYNICKYVLSPSFWLAVVQHNCPMNLQESLLPKVSPRLWCRWYPWPLGAACTPAPLLWYDTCTGERTGSHCKKTSGFYVPHQMINPSRPIQCFGLGCLDNKFGLWVRKTVYTSYTPFGHW